MQEIISRVTCLIFSLHLQTEEIEGIQHDHSITSKINLVDLAGSERQSQAQTSGERLRVGSERGRGSRKVVTGSRRPKPRGRGLRWVVRGGKGAGR